MAVEGSESEPGRVVWITGLSGAGKTTVSRETVGLLFHVTLLLPVFLDGDELRRALRMTHLTATHERYELARNYARLCEVFSRQGHDVVCATISMFHDIHDWNRSNIDRYVEVFLDVPIAELRKRDAKNVYGENDEQIVGLGQSAEMPLSPHLAIANYGGNSPAATARHVVDYLAAKYPRSYPPSI